MFQPMRTQGGHLDFKIGLKNTNLERTLKSCILTRFIEFCSAVPEEKSKMSQPIRGQELEEDQLHFPNWPDIHNFGTGR